MTSSLECVSHGIREVDTRLATNQAHSLPSLHPAVAENNLSFTQTGSPPSTYGTVAVAESSLAVYPNQIPPSPDIAVAEEIWETKKASKPCDVAIATVEDSPSATELIEIFRFLDLSSEIRNRVYHILLGPPQDPSICLTQVLDHRPLEGQNGGVNLDPKFRTKSVKLNRKHEDPNWGVVHQVGPQHLSILLVSKQIYVEAFHVFYTKNCLSFTDTGLLYRFLKNIGYTRRQHLTMVYFLWRGPDAKEAFRLLKTCRRLKTVQFTVPCSHPPGYEALKEVRVENPKARALVHLTPAENSPLDTRNHSSCFGDYRCHCLCRRRYEPASSMQELEKAMMRPRREQDLPDPSEKFDLFKPKREHFKKSEEQDLRQEEASFHQFIGRIEQQGRKLRYLGRRNKVMEATLNQTLTGSAVDDYFRDFADKLAQDKRMAKFAERWHAKRRAEQEAKERDERERKEAIEEKERAVEMRREARELKWKLAREAREQAKKGAREARELKRRTAREAKEREKMMAGEARAQKKAAREEAKGRHKKTTRKSTKGTNSVEEEKEAVSKSKEL